MNIKIGAKIKALRKRDEITQEQLANALGITDKAISRWESENGYPDIEYITPIANFFNVTTDYLFDHDTSEKLRKIDEYCEKYETHARLREEQEGIDIARQALAEFPGEEKLLFLLARALYAKWSNYGTRSHSDGAITKKIYDYEYHKSYDCWEEAIKIMGELLATSTDDAIRSECRRMLIDIYGKIGEKNKLTELANQCDSIYNCKEFLLSLFTDGKDAIGNMQNLLKLQIEQLNFTLPYLTWHYVRDKETAVEANRIMIGLYKFVYSDGNYGQHHFVYITWYENLAHNLIDCGKFDEALDALDMAYEHAKKFDIYIDEMQEKGTFQYTAPLVNLTTDDVSTSGVYITKRVPELLKSLKNDSVREEYGWCYYKKICNDLRYIELVSKIEADIEETHKKLN